MSNPLNLCQTGCNGNFCCDVGNGFYMILNEYILFLFLRCSLCFIIC